MWRRIQVPLSYSFWDLHVAIQDAMGWLDYHLHEFRLLDSKDRVRTIGIPTGEEETDQSPPIPGWRVRVSEYFNHRLHHALPALYVYDFGDDWEHALVYEDEQPTEDAATYPDALAGPAAVRRKTAAVHGYTEFLAAISDRSHPERESLLAGAGGSYDPDAFDPTRNLELVEDLPDCSQKLWKLPCEGGMIASRISECHQLLADQVIERALGTETPLDPLHRPTLVNPSLLEPHERNIVSTGIRCNHRCSRNRGQSPGTTVG